MAANAMYLSVTNRPLLSSPVTIKSLQVRSFTVRCSTGSAATGAAVSGQFVLMTNPHIGNTGVNIDDVDTRAITLRLRKDGRLIGVLSTEESKTDEQLLEMSRTWDNYGL